MKTDRISNAFCPQRLSGQGKSAAFVSYACAGDPDFESSVRVFKELIDAGVDVLEIGVPFSDPLADGPTNQRAAERSLSNGMTADDVFRLVKRVREFSSEVAIVFYTYYNLVFSRGHENYVKAAKDAGVDGLLVLDLPPEEASEYLKACSKYDMKTVFIVAPTTPEARISLITKATTGFVYYVSREGVTGERSDMAEGVTQALDQIRAHTDLPVAVGFGISNRDQVALTAKEASGVVVGSAIVRRCAELSSSSSGKWKDFRLFLQELVSGVREAG